VFNHAWIWITKTTDLHAKQPPYWFCAKCGVRVKTKVQPDNTGCQTEK
jgi:hypothetical protein